MKLPSLKPKALLLKALVLLVMTPVFGVQDDILKAGAVRKLDASKNPKQTVSAELGSGYSLITVESYDADFAVTVLDQQGNELLRANGSEAQQARTLWRVPLSFIRTSPSLIQINVSIRKTTAPSASVKISYTTSRPAAAVDAESAAAEKLLYESQTPSVGGGEGATRGIEMLEDAARRWALADDEFGIGVARLSIAWLRLASKDVTADRDASAALEHFSSVRDERGRARSLEAKADAAFLRKDLDGSFAQLVLAADAEAKIGDFVAEARLRMKAARNLLPYSDPKLYKPETIAKARGAAEQARILYSTVGDSDGEAAALDLMAVCSALELRFDEAIAAYESGLALRQSSNDEIGIATSKKNIADVRSEKTRIEGDIFKKNDVDPDPNPPTGNSKKILLETMRMTTSLRNSGETYFRLSQYDRAANFFERSVALNRTQNLVPAQISDLNRLASSYMKMGRYDRAIMALGASIYLQRGSGDVSGESATLSQLSLAAAKSGDATSAILYGKQALNLMASQGVDVSKVDASLRLGLLDDRSAVLRFLPSLMLSEGRSSEALEVLGAVKETEYSSSLVGPAPNVKIPYSEAEEKTVAQLQKVAALGRRQFELNQIVANGKSLTPSEKEELEGIRSQLEEANKAVNASLSELRASGRGAADRIDQFRRQAQLSGVLRSIRNETGTEAVALFTLLGVGDVQIGRTVEKQVEYGWMILVTPTFTKAYPIDVSELDGTVADFRIALTDPSLDPTPASQKLYGKLFRGKSSAASKTLEDDLGELFKDARSAPTVLWSLDGILRTVPVSALHDGRKYLMEKYRNYLFTSETLPRLSQSDSDKRAAIGFGMSKAAFVASKTFPALPGAKEEVDRIVIASAGDAGFIRGTVKIDDEFTAKELFALEDEPYTVVHIASHFSFDSAKPEDSFLLVGDGRVTLGELENRQGLFGGVDLLTLSACETGFENFGTGYGNGREAESLAYVASRLGAKTVISSLWKVSDVGTSELMMRFYRYWNDVPGRTKGEALRLAQLSMLEGASENAADSPPVRRSKIVGASGAANGTPRWNPTGRPAYSHPFFWAPFTLTGNWK